MLAVNGSTREARIYARAPAAVLLSSKRRASREDPRAIFYEFAWIDVASYERARAARFIEIARPWNAIREQLERFFLIAPRAGSVSIHEEDAPPRPV